MRNHRLFAAGLAAALMLGVASPALATPGPGKGKGKALAKGHQSPKTKPNKPNPHKPEAPKTKGKKGGVSGGGSIVGGEFSIQARLRSKSKGAHFNFTSTDGTTKVRCRDGFQDFTPVFTATEGSATVTFNNCQVTGQSAPVNVTVDVKDRAKNDAHDEAPAAATPPVVDWMGFSYRAPSAATPTSLSGDMTSGGIKVRP